MINSKKMTVTQRAKSVKQPRGGYVKRTDFDQTILEDTGKDLIDGENIHASLIGIAIDYITRYMLTGDLAESFKLSLLGARLKRESETAESLLCSIKGLDDDSITSAIKLVGFDVVYRNGGYGYIPISEINPNQAVIKNTRTMVERTLNFFKEYGPITSYGFSFEGAYTDVIINGDGDYLTKDTLWDLKVIKGNINKNHTMQILIYWRMGLRSDFDSFKNIKYLGIYNPRKNIVYRYDLANIDRKTIEIVDKQVIGYSDSIF